MSTRVFSPVSTRAAAQRVGPIDLRAGRPDLGGERLDVLGVGAGQRDDGDRVTVQPAGVQPGCDARGERVGVRRPRLVLRVGGRLRRRGGGLGRGPADVAERAAAERDARGHGHHDRDERDE